MRWIKAIFWHVRSQEELSFTAHSGTDDIREAYYNITSPPSIRFRGVYSTEIVRLPYSDRVCIYTIQRHNPSWTSPLLGATCSTPPLPPTLSTRRR
jgi:hypothetical protein